MQTREIKRLFLIGMNTYSEYQKEYFKNFFKLINEDEFVISFMDTKEKPNILPINLGNFIPFVTEVLHCLFEKIPITQDNIYIFFTNCDVMTISNIITVKSHHAKNIYMAECPPTFINPSVFAALKKEYEIKTTTTPEEDIKRIRQI